jgi:TRAP-type transport system periplasmic protein
LPTDLRAVIDKTTGETLSLKAVEAFERRSDNGLAAVKKAGREIITLAPAEVARWRAALQPMIQSTIADAEKAGVPARELLMAAKYLK